MPVTITEIPDVLETYFLDEAKTMPVSYWTMSKTKAGFLGPGFKRYSGKGVMAGWALPILCPTGNDLAVLAAIQFVFKNVSKGRWVPIITSDGENLSECAMWNYMKSATAWEAGMVGAVINGFAQDIDETLLKLGGEFSVFALGTSPIHPVQAPGGVIGEAIEINGVKICAGDLIVGDIDGVIRIKADDVPDAFHDCRENIVDVCNRLAHVREGKSALDILDISDELKNSIGLA